MKILKLFLIIFLLQYTSCKSSEPINNASTETVIDTFYVEVPTEALEALPEDTFFLNEKYNDKMPSSNVQAQLGTEEQTEEQTEEFAEVLSEDSVIYVNQNTKEYGNITYVMSDTMYVGTVSIVDLTVSMTIDVAKIINRIESFTDSNIVSHKIRVGKQMKVRLLDRSGTSFKIVPLTDEVQFIEDNDFTRWSWGVTPLIPGDNNLTIIVSLIKDDIPKTVEVHEDIIKVFSTTGFFAKLLNFFAEYWLSLSSTFFVPFILFMGNRYRNKKKAKNDRIK